MPPLSDRIYFPSLEDCLSGDPLSDFSGERQVSSAIIDFFDDEYVHGLLKKPSSVFASPSDATQKDFETKTAPINATLASTDGVDINLVREDAKWLGKAARLNLVAALRIVVVDIQSRPSRHLTGPLSSQDAANLQEAAGLSNGQGSSFLSELGAAAAADADEIWTEFEKPETRRRRLFNTYLEERRYFAMSADYAHSIKLYNRLPITAPVEHNLNQLYRLTMPEQAKDEIEVLLPAYMSVVGERMDGLGRGLSELTDDALILLEDLELSYFRTQLTESIHAMSVVLQLADNLQNEFAPASAIGSWFSIMDRHAFLSQLQPIHESIAELCVPAKTLAAVVSVALLKPNLCMKYFQDREEDPALADNSHDSYLLAPDVLEQVHSTIIGASEANIETATPVCFTWSVILGEMNRSYHSRSEKRDNLLLQSSRERFESGAVIRPSTGRRNSAGSIYSIESSRFDNFLEATSTSRDFQTAERMARSVSDGGYVYNVMSAMASAMGSTPEGSMTPLLSSRVRAWLVEVIRTADPLVGYQEATVGTLLTLLSTDREYWDIEKGRGLEATHDVIASMVQDDWLQQSFLRTALDRYPEEFLPFIAMCRILSSTLSLEGDSADQILALLRQTPTLTFNLPLSTRTEDVTEEENINYYHLLDELQLVALTSSRGRRHVDHDDLRIPAGTFGRYLIQDGQFSQLEFTHSTLSLLGRRLEINLAPDTYACLFGDFTPDVTAEVILLFATLIRVDCLKTAQANPDASSIIHLGSDIIQEASKYMAAGRDLVSVICDTMDHFLQDDLATTDESAVSVLTSCTQFFHSILPLCPGRVWSYLARSELLNSESRAGKLARITGTLDLVANRYEFLNSSAQLFLDLIDTVVSSAAQRRLGSKAAGRQRADVAPWLGISERVLSKVSHSIAQSAIDIFENTSTWRFESETKRIVLLHNVVPILDKIVSDCYSMGDVQSSSGLTSTLQPAASYVVDCFLEPSSGTLRFQPILASFTAACMSSDSTLYAARYEILYGQVRSVLDFCTTLLRVSDLLDRSSSMIESYLFKSSTLLARLCAVSSHFRVPAMKLLEALVINAGKSKNEPPSLLGYLGPPTSRSFLQLLSTLGKPYSLATDTRATWKFFSSILRNRQQWMSNCLLTGQTPREAMKRDNKKKEAAPNSVFAAALRKLSQLQDLEPAHAMVVLDFVASAQNYWPWTVFTLQKDTSYLEGLQAYVRELKPSHVTVKSNATKAAVEARIAAYIGEIIAMQLYHSRHLGNADALAKKLMSDLDYYLRDGVEVAGYNKSLHNNFARNFANKYGGCSLDDFQRTMLEPRELGTEFYYDLGRATKMLIFDPGWLGRKQNGFRMEMELANANLSLVDAQIALFHAWEFLLLELSICLPTNETIARQMLQVAQQCLNANQGVPGPESIFLKVVDARASLALVLIQRLATSSLPIKDINHLLTTVVVTVSSVDDPFLPETISYYRKLLKSLFVVLRAYQVNADKGGGSEDSAGTSASSVTVTQTVLNVLDRVVGRGFRTLVSLIHDDQSSVCPEDLALLTAILQACLSLPGMEQSQTQVLNIMSTHSCFYAATSLFSWADKLADQGDPVYGELSMLYLLELSTLPMLAEQMACDGILSVLLTSNLTKYMLKARISPYAEAATSQRCYSIWVKGLLPLMLNLLTALGATVAPEIAYVLNQFPQLLRLSIERFEVPGASRTQSKATAQYVTLLGTSEIHSLALLTRVLGALRVNNGDIGEVEWDATGLLENVEFWLASNKLLKERLMPLGQREMDWRATKVKGRGDNVLEQKVISQLEAVRTVLSEDVE
ncbi:nuclear pore complex protein Nup188 [Geosmithia morbida]|uniref:Nuclear pore complex protein Nup188 n=1 Tax=Geosmithia morbida TaxID=1094350 RepID=A0A9P4YWP6_9HYPO|nr:nuclear pore complex protein Nup188 [Geosmithia morbida]KAF4123159.1 nuclear pore complex protein Nup188 [Geosmithia morbida]